MRYPSPSPPEHQIGGQFHILEDELRGVGGALPELVFEPRDAVARRIGRNDEGADPPASGLGVGDRENNRDISGRTRGDELLRAVDDPAVAVATARVLIAAASEPASGSVRQKQASIFPSAIGTRNRRFCSSEP